ncbi:hypothetical protein D9M72_255350 [compost metagenome]
MLPAEQAEGATDEGIDAVLTVVEAVGAAHELRAHARHRVDRAVGARVLDEGITFEMVQRELGLPPVRPVML